MSGVFEHLDEVLTRVIRQRDELLADPLAVDRSARLVAVFETEARTWSQFYELAGLRLVWRAALAAEAGARANAALWARRAAAEQAGWRPATSWAAAQIGPCRPAALTTASSGRGDR